MYLCKNEKYQISFKLYISNGFIYSMGGLWIREKNKIK